MKTPKKEKHFIKKPSYPGGPKALWAFIRKNLRYPKEAQEKEISGFVRLKFSIDRKGKVIATQIIHSLGYGCDDEAIRVISMLRYNVPKQRKIKVKFHKTINVRFKPPKKKTFEITLTKKKPEPKEKVQEKKKSGYEYTVTIN